MNPMLSKTPGYASITRVSSNQEGCISSSEHYQPTLPSSGEYSQQELSMPQSRFPPNRRDGSEASINNSNHPLVNSVTNDEDDWAVDSKKPVRAQYRTCNYRETFSRSSVGMTHGQQLKKSTIRESNKTKTTEPTLLAQSAVSSSGCFDQDSYLIRYERMMIEQEMEQISTLSHVQSLLGLLEDSLLKGHIRKDDNNLLKEFCLEDLKRIHDKIKFSSEFEIIKTDKQFMMVLEILCEKKVYSTYIDGNGKGGKNGHGNRIPKINERKKISWAEIIQCYRICVVGMQTLETIGSESTIRQRAKERTLAMLSLYQQSYLSNCSTSVHESPNKYESSSSKMRYDDSTIQLVGVDQGRQQGSRKPGRLFVHYIVSFLIGAIVAGILFVKFPSTTKMIARYQDIPATKPTQGVKYSREANKSFYSTINVAPPEIESNTNEDITRTLEKRTTSTKELLSSTTSRVVFPIPRARSAHSTALSPPFGRKFVNEFDIEENVDDDVTKNQRSNDLELATTIGGTAAIIYFLSPFVWGNVITAATGFIPMGLTVTIATLIGHSVNKLISFIWRKLQRNGNKKKNFSKR